MRLNIYCKIFLMLGFFLLAEDDVGATAMWNDGKKVTVEEKMDSITTEENVETKSENIFYVDEWIKGWFVRIDKDQDHEIDRNEFIDAMETFGVEENYLSIFNIERVNPDGKLNLKEFKFFVDSTAILTENDKTNIAAANPETPEGESLDIVKLLAGVVVISLLMAAFRLM